MYHALEGGALPIYKVAPNADMLLPERSVIFAADFAGPAELAAYLQRLDADDWLYASYHEWRREGSGGLAAGTNLNRLLSATQQIGPECRLCIKLADGSGPDVPSGGKLVDERRYYDGSPWQWEAAYPLLAAWFPK